MTLKKALCNNCHNVAKYSTESTMDCVCPYCGNILAKYTPPLMPLVDFVDKALEEVEG